ncbi:class II fructose-bisphosphate aldolase [Candidatus Micrarchaeota archaeon]|nr:class II fructose-bisphosphate aldolase [Candidatus Micrarchaeota archaeon]
MVYVNTDLLFKKAEKGNYAVGQFNVFNLETVLAVVNECVELNSPAIIAVTESSINYAGIHNLVDLIKPLLEGTKNRFAFHLDHGRSLDTCEKAIKEGFSSVMIDGSQLSFEENIEITRKVVSIGKKKKVSVEAELGKLVSSEENNSSNNFTNPEQAKEFVKKTKCSSLAIAVGTSHGAYKFKGEAELDFERIKKIKSLTKIPLVLHGASSVPKEIVEKANKFGAKIEEAKGVDEASIKKAIQCGIRKINIDTDLRLGFTAAVREYLQERPAIFDPRQILGHARAEIREIVKQKIALFGSQNKG